MNLIAAQPAANWPLLVYIAAVVLMVGGMIVLSYVLGQRHRERATNVPYESGMEPSGSARLKFGAEFYLIAMFFVIFDLESIFIFAWAIGVRELGWAGYASVAVFVGLLVAALVYLWRVGALEWGTGARKALWKRIEKERES